MSHGADFLLENENEPWGRCGGRGEALRKGTCKVPFGPSHHLPVAVLGVCVAITCHATPFARHGDMVGVRACTGVECGRGYSYCGRGYSDLVLFLRVEGGILKIEEEGILRGRG